MSRKDGQEQTQRCRVAERSGHVRARVSWSELRIGRANLPISFRLSSVNETG